MPRIPRLLAFGRAIVPLVLTTGVVFGVGLFPSTGPTALAAPSSAPSADTMNQFTYGGWLFSSASPWNLPATGAVDPNSGAMTRGLGASMANHGPGINLSSWTVPLYYADASTPRVAVKDTTGWWGGFASAPMPREARPDPAGDHHLVVWDVPNGRLYEYWRAAKIRGRWQADEAVALDAWGLGYQTGTWQNSARAYGGSAIAGVIRYQEMKVGAIPHALALAYPATRGDDYARAGGLSGVWGIASHTDDSSAGSRNTAGNIPQGARLRLKSSVDLSLRCGANRACTVIGQALKTYGAFVVDTAGAPVFYAENLQDKQVSWSGLLQTDDARAFQSTDFEVLALPPLTAAP